LLNDAKDPKLMTGRSKTSDSGKKTGRRATAVRAKSMEAAYLETAIGRYSPEVAATGMAGLKKLRARFPGARQLVYERRQSLPIGFAPAQRGSAVFSLVLYPRWVRFFFLEGVAIDDPEGRLEGTGSQVRSIRVDQRAAIFDDPYIRGLMAQALRVAGSNLKAGAGEIVLKSKLKL
jgi:hypothetical protein